MVAKLKPGETAPFTQHLEELRGRLIWCVGAIAVAFLAMWGISDILLKPFSSLMQGQPMVFISPTEAFFVHMKVAFYAGLGLCVPIFIYHVWAFVSPGLLDNEKKYTFPFMLAAAIFFAIGASFCYFLVLPFGLSFLLGFGGEIMSPMISISALVGFCVTLMFVFGLVFQLPLIVIFLNLIGLVTTDQLSAFRAYLIVISFIVSAIITPPDVFTQIVLSLPIILLYEFSIMFLKVFGKKKIKEVEEEKSANPDSIRSSTDSGA